MKIHKLLLYSVVVLLLGAIVYLPAAVFQLRNHLLFDVIHTERVSQAEEGGAEAVSTEDRLRLISRGISADSGIAMMWQRMEQEKIVDACKLAFHTISQLGILPEEQKSEIGAVDGQLVTYSDWEKNQSVQVYSLVMTDYATYQAAVVMDVETKKVYQFEIRFFSANFITEQKPPDVLLDAFCKQLGIRLQEPPIFDYGTFRKYRVEGTEVFYLFPYFEDGIMMRIQNENDMEELVSEGRGGVLVDEAGGPVRATLRGFTDLDNSSVIVSTRAGRRKNAVKYAKMMGK